MKVFGIVGRKDSGKTHLVVRLIHALRSRGLLVSSVKHTHHHVPQLEPPGKDSYRHRAAGAGEVVLATDHGWVLFHDLRPPDSSPAAAAAPPPTLGEILPRLAPCDVLLVEGYKHDRSVARVEVFRSGEAGEPPLAELDDTILAVACPAAMGRLSARLEERRLDLDDTGAIADFLLSH